MKKKRLTAFLLSMILSVIPAISCLAEGTEQVLEANDLTDQIVIYHTNDMHGALEEGSGKFSIAQTAALKENTEHAFLVDAGDATQGVPLASITKGKDVIRLMNMAGYDAMCLGNHEFDYDMQILQENIGLAEFPILGANALYNGAPVGQTDQQNGAYTILETGGRKIGVFGLITKDTSTKANPEVVGQIDFTDEVETAKEQIDILEEQDVDAIIALGHLGNEGGTSCTSEDLAQAMTGEYQGKLDAIIDGHSHTIENAQGGLLEPGQASIHYGAIPRTEGYEAEPYTARIRIQNPEGNPLAGTKISYYVDGEGAFEGETDGEGFLAIEGLEPGEHGIRLDENQREVYVNNYIGIGITEVENVFSYPKLVWTGEEPEEPDEPVDPQKPDPQKPSGGNTSEKTPVKTATVKTGDENRTMVWTVLLFASFGIAGSILYRKRKRG